MISIPLDGESFAPCFMPLDVFQCLLIYSLCILLLRENCINLNYVELVNSAFQVYEILLLCRRELLIFEKMVLYSLY